MSLQLQLDQATHTYRLDGEVLPGVTRVLKVLDSMEHIPRATLDAKAALGRAVHAAVQYDNEGTLDDESVSDAVRPYLQSWRLLRAVKKVEILAAELMVAHPMHRYAGTLDLKVQMDGARWIVDLKSCVSLWPSVGPQTAAYMAAHGDTQVSRRAAVLLQADGSIGRFVELNNPNDWPVFLAALSIWRFREAHAAIR